jgi:16S rRNA processing protein RimM
MTDPEAWVPLAEITRPHGVKGELRLKLFNKASDILLRQDEVLVRMPGGEEHEVSVDRARRADDAILLKLFSVDDRNRAEEMRGALVCVRRRDFEPPEEGEFYTVDIVGADAMLVADDGIQLEPLGRILDVMSYPTLEALVVRPEDEGGDWEVPLTDAFVRRVDIAARRVEILTLEGLERLPTKKRARDRAGEASDVAPPDPSEV